MAALRAVRASAEPALAGAARRRAGAGRLRAAADRGRRGGPAAPARPLDLARLHLRGVERRHDLLGVQRHGGRRHFRHLLQRPPDAADLAPVPPGEAENGRRAAVHFPGGHVDRLGAGLFLRGHLLALAHARRRFRAQHAHGAVVRVHRHARRLALGMGGEPRHLRPDRGRLRRNFGLGLLL